MSYFQKNCQNEDILEIYGMLAKLGMVTSQCAENLNSLFSNIVAVADLSLSRMPLRKQNWHQELLPSENLPSRYLSNSVNISTNLVHGQHLVLSYHNHEDLDYFV